MPGDVWTVDRILAWIESYLAQHGDAKPRASAQWLVSEALGLTKMQLYLDPERPLSAEERGVLRDYTKRRASGEPVQYITGSVDFRYLTFRVAPGVLIPRPETEVLVSEALALLPAPSKPQDDFDAQIIARYRDLAGDAAELPADEGRAQVPNALEVADICTGSGCIACSIAYERPATHVTATDISQEAVSLARANVKALGLDGRVDVVQCDLGEGIESELQGSIDLVVSNPPYVPSSLLASLPREVSRFEPELALDGGASGLDVFERLLGWCACALKPGGAFAFELHETCLDEAERIAKSSGFVDVHVKRDLAGKPRVLTGIMPSNMPTAS